MKTVTKDSGKANLKRAVLLVALAVVLGSTGCQKDDELMPSNNESVENALPASSSRALPNIDESATIIDNGNLVAINAFTLIKIDHQAARSALPDYSVTVRSNGLVIYEGRRNVRVKDRVVFRIDDATLPLLHKVFDQYSFYYIVPDFKVDADVPVVFTTYQPTQLIRPRRIYDNYLDNPSKLILIRESVEQLLGIEKYVNTRWVSLEQEPLP